MKKLVELTLIAFVLVFAASCAGTAPPAPTATIPPTLPPPTETPAPTETPLPPPTETLIPPTPTEEGFLLPLPQGEPLSQWNGVPIMPGALNGEESDSDAYIFTIQSSSEDIQNFYQSELPKVGWDFLAVGEGDTGNVLMIFMGEKGTFTVSIFTVDETESLYYVMLLEA